MVARAMASAIWLCFPSIFFFSKRKNNFKTGRLFLIILFAFKYIHYLSLCLFLNKTGTKN